MAAVGRASSIWAAESAAGFVSFFCFATEPKSEIEAEVESMTVMLALTMAVVAVESAMVAVTMTVEAWAAIDTFVGILQS